MASVTAGLTSVSCEVPGPRYSEATDYPSRVADELTKALGQDPSFQGHQFRVLRAWSWRWGRYGAVLQVEGVTTPAQQAAVLSHLRAIKQSLNTGRFISVESIDVLRNGAGPSNVVGKVVI